MKKSSILITLMLFGGRLFGSEAADSDKLKSFDERLKKVEKQLLSLSEFKEEGERHMKLFEFNSFLDTFITPLEQKLKELEDRTTQLDNQLNPVEQQNSLFEV